MLPCRLHYTKREPFEADLAALAAWRAGLPPAARPQMVWMDVPLQHFATPDGHFKKQLMEQVGAGHYVCSAPPAPRGC